MRAGRIEVRGLTHSFGSGRPVLVDVDLVVEAGDVVVVHGRNGAGKSTLLRIVAGVLRGRSGAVRRGGRLGYLPQRGDAPPPRLSAAAWLTTLARMRHGSAASEAAALLTSLAVDTPAQAMDRLSVGTVSKVLLAGALDGRPDVVVLDEPFAAIDPVARAAAASLIAAAAADGAAVLVSDHEGSAAAVATRNLSISNGRLTAGGETTPAAMWRIVAAHGDGTVRELAVPGAERESVLLRLLTDGDQVLRVEEVT